MQQRALHRTRDRVQRTQPVRGPLGLPYGARAPVQLGNEWHRDPGASLRRHRHHHGHRVPAARRK